MKLTRSLAVPAAALALIAGGLAVGAATPDWGVGAPTPAPSASFTLPPVLAAHLECTEDEPCWDCETMGNRICGTATLSPTDRSDAWALWESAGGAEYLLVNPHARVELSGYTVTDPYAQGVPELGTQQLALFGGTVWYVFTAEAI